MRIEFIGLPGTGKTTLRKFIISKHNRFIHRQWLSMDDVILDWYASQQNSKLLFGLNRLIQFNQPSFFIRQIKLKMLRKIRSYAMHNMREMDNYLSPCCEFFIKEISNTKTINPVQKIIGINMIKSVIFATFFADHYYCNKIVLFDEGFGLRAIGLSRFGASEETILKYFELTPQPDAYVIMTLNDEERNQRMIIRGDDKIIRSFYQKYNEKMTNAFKIVQCAIKKKNVPSIYIDAEDTLEKNAKIVTSFVQSLNQ